MSKEPCTKEEKKDDFFVQNEQEAPKAEETEQVNIFPEGTQEPQQDPKAVQAELDRIKTQQQFKVARMNLLLVALFTVINIVAYFFSDFYLLFSANIPYMITVFGDLIAMEIGAPALTYLSVGVSLVLTAPYFLGYFLSKKHYGWIVACLVYFALDTVAMLLFVLIGGGIGSALLDVVFHAWVIYELFKGIRAGKAIKDASPVGEDVSES